MQRNKSGIQSSEQQQAKYDLKINSVEAKTDSVPIRVVRRSKIADSIFALSFAGIIANIVSRTLKYTRMESTVTYKLMKIHLSM